MPEPEYPDFPSLINAIAESLGKAGDMLSPILNTLTSVGIESLITQLMREVPDLSPELEREIADQDRRVRKALERSDHIGGLGWTVTLRMAESDVTILSEMNLSGEADCYMLAWYKNDDLDLKRSEKRLLSVGQLEPFRTVLSQCFVAYRRGEYAITIPCLIAALEFGLRNLVPPEDFFATDVEMRIKRLYKNHAISGKDQSFDFYVLMSLNAFVQWLYRQYRSKHRNEDRIFRHGIQHGTQQPPNEEVEVLRLFHALDAIADLYWAVEFND
jgi:hypothetical protein